MATAAELLASTYETDDTTLVIDNYLRTISIPKSITNLGVEHDDDVLRLNFRMPRYLDDTDLSKFLIRINYLNANAESDVYTVSDKLVATDFITFSWLIGPNATAYKGSTKFNVCMVITDGEGFVQKEYNTTIASLPVLEGLEVDPGVQYEYVDFIEQWRQQLFGMEDSLTTRIQSELETAANTLEEKGAEVLATIPEDYQITYQRAEDGIRTKADAIVRTAEGETIVAADSSDDRVRNLRVFGKTTQTVTTGKNLFNPAVLIDAGWSEADGVYYGASSALTDKRPDCVFKENTQYSISLTAKGAGLGDVSVFVYVNYTDGTYSTAIKTASSNTPARYKYTTSVGKTVDYIRFSYGYNQQTYLWDIQIEEGAVVTAYEPYTNGLATPSPERPQAMLDKEPTVVVTGKNLIDLHSLALHTNKTLVVSDDGYTATVSGGSDKAYAQSRYLMPEALVTSLRGKKLCLSVDSFTKSNEAVHSPLQTNIKCADGFVMYPSCYENCLVNEFTVPHNVTEISVSIYTNNSASVIDTDNMVTITGVRLTLTDSTEFEPYKEIRYIDVPPIKGIPVESGGNYVDADDQQWICDEVDFERGVYIQRVYTLVFTGNENVSREERTGGTYRFVLHSNNPTRCSPLFGCYCSHFLYDPSPISDNGVDRTVSMWTTGHAYCRCDSITSVGDMCQWIINQYDAGTPLTIKYVLETPIETALTVEELEAYKEIYTNYPNTIVMNDDGAWMELKYNADTELWVNSKLDERLPSNNKSATAIVQEASGEIVRVNDSSDDYVRELTLFGKTIQNGVPSPDVPTTLSTICDDGYIDLTVAGKNLLNVTLTSGTRSGLDVVVSDDGKIKVSGTSTGGAIYLQKNLILAPGIYTFSVGTTLVMESGNGIWINGGDVKTFFTSGDNVTFTLANKSAVNVYLFPTNGAVWDATLYPQLELGSKATAYELYKGKTITVPTPTGLPGFPVTSGGNYTDSSGQQWIADEINFERGVYVHRIGRITVDNSLTYFYNTDNNFLHTASGIFNNVASWETKILSTHFVAVGNGIDMYDYGWFQFSGNGGIRFRIEGIDSVESLATWLDTNTPEVIYPLATPVETALPYKQLTAYRAVEPHTHYTSTTVHNDKCAWMELTYNVDTKTYVDNSIKQSLTNVLEAIENGSY